MRLLENNLQRDLPPVLDQASSCAQEKAATNLGLCLKMGELWLTTAQSIVMIKIYVKELSLKIKTKYIDQQRGNKQIDQEVNHQCKFNKIQTLNRQLLQVDPLTNRQRFRISFRSLPSTFRSTRLCSQNLQMILALNPVLTEPHKFRDIQLLFLLGNSMAN